MKGILLDAYPEGDKIVLWVKNHDKAFKESVDYTARILLQADDNRKALDKVSDRGYLCEQAYVKDIVSDKLNEAVSVSTRDLEHLSWVVRDLERLGGYRWRLYNADVGAEQMYLYERGLNPFSKIDTVDGLQKLGECSNPQLKTRRITVKGVEDPLVSYNHRIKKIDYGGHIIVGGEKNILSDLKHRIDVEDPDVLLVDGGDRYAVDYLLARYRVNDIPFHLGRETQDFTERTGKSYFSYGQAVRRNPSHYLKGRYHIDTSDFMYREGGLDGVTELARISYLPVQKVARLSPGAAITNLYVFTAYRMGYPIPYKINMVEDFKSARTLFEADKGGFIYEPEVGFHTDCAEIDFTSLYPHIMTNYNISPETILCGCCRGKNTVPYAGYHVCEKRRGLVPTVLKPILDRRLQLKRLHMDTGDRRYKAMSDALKWVLVCSFGYTGYRRSRFGRIEAHESITSYARHILLESTRIAEDMGFTVLHGIVDSLWVQKPGLTEADVQALVERIYGRYRIPVNVEGIYRWIVFLPSASAPIAPVPNRYYGVFRDGGLKVRGIELRRRDAPPIVKQFQRQVLEILAKAQSKQEFTRLIPESMRLLRRYARQIMDGKIGWGELAVKKRVNRLDYEGVCPQKVVLGKLAKQGIRVHPGECIEYVIRNMRSSNPQNRYTPKAMPEDGTYDRRKYVQLLAASLENLYATFGYTRQRILDELYGGTQTTLA